MRALGAGLLSAAVLVFAGCGGATTPAVTQNASTSTSTSTSGHLNLIVPVSANASSSSRSAAFISPSVNSIAITVNGGAATIADVSSTSTACTSTTNGRTCTIPITAPIGSVTFGFTEYDAAGGTGKTLGSGSAATTTVAGQAFTVSATLNGVPSVIQLAVASVPAAGSPASTTLTVMVLDPDGNTIIGPGNYTAPVTLSVTDSTNQTTLSTTSITSPASTVTINYAGGYNTNATIAATSATTSSTAIAFAPTGSQAVYYITDAGSNSLTAFPVTANGNVAPLRTVSGALTGLTFPRRIVSDTSANLYVANAGNPSSTPAIPQSITVYAPRPSGNVAPIRTLTGSNTFITGVDGIAVDAQGTIFATDCGSCYLSSGAPAVLVFAAGANGNVAPTRNIVGAATTLNDPTSLVLDGAGNILVSDYVANAIDVFPTTATGNVAPSGVISGAATGISNPENVSVDASGLIYVGNAGNHTVTVYAAGSRGNVAPIRTLSGSNTHISDATAVVFDTAGNIYITDITNNTVAVFAPNASGNQTPLLFVSGAATNIFGPIGLALSP